MNSRLLPETADDIWAVRDVLARIDRGAKQHQGGPSLCTLMGLPR
jgi:hypothetical protein